MDPYQVTFHTWNKVALLYQEKFMELDLYDDTYDRFCSLVEKPGAKVLEIGCGPGNITRYLQAKRSDFRIEAIDVAPAMIDLAKENVPTASFRIMDARKLDTIVDQYDALMCGFALPYLSKEDYTKLFRDCAHLLVPGGVAYFSTIEGDYTQSGYKAASTGDQTYVYYHSEAELVKELQANGFEVVDIQRKLFNKADGVASTDLILIAQKK